MYARISDFICFLEQALQETNGQDLPIYIMVEGGIGPVPMTPEQMKNGLVSVVGPTTTINGIPIEKHIVIKAADLDLEDFTAQHYRCKGWLNDKIPKTE